MQEFDSPPDRRGTHSLKYEGTRHFDVGLEVIPLWVADMDFSAPAAVRRALAGRVRHGIFGYTRDDPGFTEAAAAWWQRRHKTAWSGHELEPLPSVMTGLDWLLEGLSQPGDWVAVPSPVYQPFFNAVSHRGRRVLELPLRVGPEGAWGFDPADWNRRLSEAQRQAQAEGVRLRGLLWCSPHNPTGRVWTGPELIRLGRLAERFDLWVASDEIHADLIWGRRRHRSLAQVPALAGRSVVLGAPTKTFNLAGLSLAWAWCGFDAARSALRRGRELNHLEMPNLLAQTAGRAAYESGASWLAGLGKTLAAREAALAPFCTRWGLPAPRREGTYLLWLDVRPWLEKGRYADDAALARDLETQARVKVSPGTWFQAPKGWIRLNPACPAPRWQEALERLDRWAGSSGLL